MGKCLVQEFLGELVLKVNYKSSSAFSFCTIEIKIILLCSSINFNSFCRVIIADMKVGKINSRRNGRGTNPIRFDEEGNGYVHQRRMTADLEGVRRK